MTRTYIATQSKITALLKKHGFNIKKNFGQNFLVDQNILRKIVKTAAVDGKTIAVEIGPGVASLTQMLATSAKAVQCFEIDYKLAPLLEETLTDFPNVDIIFQDFLQVDLASWYDELNLGNDEDIKVVANLPYYITTPILERLIEWFVKDTPRLTSATVMMQKEVAKRLNAKPGTKDYGSLSIFIQLFAEPTLAFTVPKNVFIPAPNVDSAIVTLHFKQNEHFDTYEAATEFLQFVRLCFATRRKTLYNNLKPHFQTTEILATLVTCGIAENIRAEQLSTEQFLLLFNELTKK